MKTFGEKVIEFNKSLHFSGKLPPNFKILNPFIENEETVEIMEKFYRKFYPDFNKRKFIIAINPGRFGAGTTGVPFTDTKHLKEECGIIMKSAKTSEISARFIYKMIHEYGSIEEFYQNFYINNAFPLAFLQKNSKGNWVNANYYDTTPLFTAAKDGIINNLKKNIELGIDTEEVYVLGLKNFKFLQKINQEEKLFGKITPLEHPRYIQQYKTKEVDSYIKKYLEAFHIE